MTDVSCAFAPRDGPTIHGKLLKNQKGICHCMPLQHKSVIEKHVRKKEDATSSYLFIFVHVCSSIFHHIDLQKANPQHKENISESAHSGALPPPLASHSKRSQSPKRCSEAALRRSVTVAVISRNAERIELAVGPWVGKMTQQ